MLNYTNSATIFVSYKNGDDNKFNGLAPTPDKYGNGPFKTLERAFASVGERRVSGFMRPMTIALTDDYYSDKTITFNCDSAVHAKKLALNGITIESWKDRCKIVGGIKLDNWKKDAFNGVPCISADLPAKNDGTEWDFVDLFVNGKRADNTRYPESGYLKVNDTENNFKWGDSVPLFMPSKWFTAKKEDLENIEGIEDAIVSFYHYWVDEHAHIESYDRETGKLTLAMPSRFTISTMYGPPEEHTSALNYFLENIPSMFRKRNEWYLDKKAGKVYFIPEDDCINPESVVAYAPTLKKIIEAYGYEENPLTDIRFNNLELMCTRSDYVSKYVKNPVTNNYEYIEDSDDGFASDIQSVCYAHGAVSFMNAVRCSVENCLIHHTGTHGIEIKTSCHDIRIENNILEDLGAGGVRIFGGRAGCEEKDRTSHCVIRGNKIFGCGKKLAAACGVLVCHANTTEISENEIAYLDYSGISVGWEWGYFDNSTYGNIIRGNHIHHVGQGRLSDMGGIYVLGKQPGTVISYNRIHDVSSAHYGGWGIYTDEGSSYMVIENNVVYNTKCESFHQHYGSYNLLRNNIFAFGKGCIRVSKREMHECCFFENNLFITDGNPIYMSSELNGITYGCKDNIVFDVSGKDIVMLKPRNGDGVGFSEWTKEFRMDIGTIVEDPLFKDIENFDFTISEDSPAVKLGFKPIKGFIASGK